MHLLVLSAFRRIHVKAYTGKRVSQCTFWCSVLSDLSEAVRLTGYLQERSQCTFWCSALSDPRPSDRQ